MRQDKAMLGSGCDGICRTGLEWDGCGLLPLISTRRGQVPVELQLRNNVHRNRVRL